MPRNGNAGSGRRAPSDCHEPDPTIERLAAKPTGDAGDDIVAGHHRLMAAFQAGITDSLEPGGTLAAASAQRLYQLRTGLAYRWQQVAEGRRAIVEIYLPGDIVGLEAVVGVPALGSVTVAAPLRYSAIEASAVRQMLQRHPAVALRLAVLLYQAQQRAAALAGQIGRLDAAERVACMLTDIHDRLRRTGLIHRQTFNLRLTQQQIGDYLGLSGVHVNRVMRWLARERITICERQVVIVEDLPRLRALARGERVASQQRRAGGAVVRTRATAAPQSQINVSGPVSASQNTAKASGRTVIDTPARL